MSKKIKVVVAFVVVLAILAVGFTVLKSEVSVNEGQKEITVVIDHYSEGILEKETIVTEAKFLGDYLRDRDDCVYEESQYGLYLRGLCGYEADDLKQLWWGIQVDGQDATTGADEIVLNDGSEYKITYHKGW